MDVDRLLVYTLGDLERRTASTDEYEVLMSAALLRKLLLDNRRLIDQVNRTHRLDLRFRISGVSPLEKIIHEDDPLFWVIEGGKLRNRLDRPAPNPNIARSSPPELAMNETLAGPLSSAPASRKTPRQAAQ